MPTQATTYNSRVTDEALEKRFRDTFRSQGGAELVDDLYAQGVIVPVVDFTAAATGQQLSQNLQTAWDFTTGSAKITTTTAVTVIPGSGFYQVDLVGSLLAEASGASLNTTISINDGSTTKPIWAQTARNGSTGTSAAVIEDKFVVFLRSGDTLEAKVARTSEVIDIWYRQIATVSGDLVNPFGFTSS
jgi:hypothetical protein